MANSESFYYCNFGEGQENIVADLVWEVFSEFEAPDYTAEGVTTFKEFIEPARLKREVLENGFKIFCCFDGEEIVGTIAFRDITHISLLFVKKSHHRKGIAKELLGVAIGEIKANNPSVKEITVNSSPYGVKIYGQLGFEATDSMQEKNGILYTPMKKIIE